MTSKNKILIVGQGLAGSVLAHQLLRKGFQVTIIDRGHDGISSSLAAGVINPVTGRRIVKSWMIDDLLPAAKKYYQEASEELGIQLWYDLPAIRLFTDTAMSNNWGIRLKNEGYEKHLNFAKATATSTLNIKNEFGAGIINYSARANISLMISSFRKKWLKEGWLKEESFIHSDLIFNINTIKYQNESYDKIVFCEGWEATKNPLFADQPFQVTKGEVLIIRIPNMPQKNIIKRKVALVPLGDGTFWAGATNYWEFENTQPTETGAEWLKTEIDAILSEPYEIIDHQAAIRPTVKNRRPILDFPEGIEANKDVPQIGIFNGFGTKGTSLVPYWADDFIRSYFT